MATKYAEIKLSELNVGIGPFVVGPAVTRKLGLSAMSQIAMDANSFYTAEWALQKGLYTKVFDSILELDEAISTFAESLCGYNPKAMAEMKTMFWRGTEDWDMLLAQRAKISGRLVLSEFTKNKLKAYE
jgi:methylglutaconyl-CoA hydratase